jgi:hypothetical protein
VRESSLKKLLRNYREKGSLVVSWPETGMTKLIRVNAFEPAVGWRGKHLQLVGQLSIVIAFL